MRVSNIPQTQLSSVTGNFVFSGLYITDFAASPSGVSGETFVTFDVWNSIAKFGTVIVFDKNGNEVIGQRIFIDKFEPNISGTKGIWEYFSRGLKYLWEDQFRLNTKLTSVSVTIPTDGYIIITNDIYADNTGLLYTLDLISFTIQFTSSFKNAFDAGVDVSKSLSEISIRKAFVEAIKDSNNGILRAIKENWTPDNTIKLGVDIDVLREHMVSDVPNVLKEMDIWAYLSKTKLGKV
jgi:hypothetical protein